jgi:putative MATE family efflux protein
MESRNTLSPDVLPTGADAIQSSAYVSHEPLPLAEPLAETVAQINAKASTVDILHGAITPTLWSFTLPLAFSFSMTIVYTWIDTYFVSHLGAPAIAAIGLCEQINFFLYTLAGGFTAGSGIIIARRIGEGRVDEAERIAQQGLSGVLVIAIVCMMATQAAIPFLLPMIAADADTLRFAGEYLPALLIGLPAGNFIYQSNVTARSTGNAGFAMRTLIMFVVLNCMFAPMLIFGIRIASMQLLPPLGMVGAGWATALANIGAALYAMIMLTRGATRFRIVWRLPLPEAAVVRSVLAIGIPSSLQFLAVSASRAIIVALHNSYGAATAAAFTLGIRLDFFVCMPVLAMGVAIETFTGQCIGAGNVKRVFAFYRAGTIQMLCIVAMLGLAVFFGGEHFARLFTQDVVVLREARSYMRIAAFIYPCFVVLVLSIRVISGAGDARRSMLIMVGALMGIQIPLCIILSRFTSLYVYGIWYGVLISYILGALVAYRQLIARSWLSVRV